MVFPSVDLGVVFTFIVIVKVDRLCAVGLLFPQRGRPAKYAAEQAIYACSAAFITMCYSPR